MRETRFIVSPIEAREDGGKATIAGYASTFDEWYELWAGYEESVARGAFKKTLRENRDSIAVVYNHDPAHVLATMASKTARFAEDDHGLRYEADLDLNDPDGLSAWRKIERGVIDKSSFSFETVKQEVTYPDENDRMAPIRRTIKEARLWEASPVLWPANPGTDVDVARCLRAVAETLDRDLDEIIQTVTAGGLPALLTTRDGTTQEPGEPPTALDTTPEPGPQASGQSIHIARLRILERL